MKIDIRSFCRPSRLRLLHDRRGSVAVAFAVLIPVLLVFAGLAIDVGWWYTIKRQNQSAADSAALSAAYEVLAGKTNVKNNLTPAATQAVTLNAYPGTSPTPTVTYPYTDAFFVSQPQFSNGVKVALTDTQPTWFGRLVTPSATIANQAVAAIKTLTPGCLLALDGTNPSATPPTYGTDSDTIYLHGNDTLTATHCAVVSDSNSSGAFHIQGNVDVTAGTIITPGQIQYTGNGSKLQPTLDYPAQVGSNYVPDPYASTLTHTFLTTGPPAMPTASDCTRGAGGIWTGNCVLKNPNSAISSGDTLSATTQIVGPWQIKGGTVTLSPGTYWITDGDLQLGPGGGGSTLQCSSCTVILTTAKSSGGVVGTLTLDSQATLTLSAPSSGTFKGLVLIQDSNGLPSKTTINSPANTQSATVNTTLTGLFYFPKTDVTFHGGPVLTGGQCLIMVVKSLLYAGTGTMSLDVSKCNNLGLTTQPGIKTAVLVE